MQKQKRKSLPFCSKFVPNPFSSFMQQINMFTKKCHLHFPLYYQSEPNPCNFLISSFSLALWWHGCIFNCAFLFTKNLSKKGNFTFKPEKSGNSHSSILPNPQSSIKWFASQTNLLSLFVPLRKSTGNQISALLHHDAA